MPAVMAGYLRASAKMLALNSPPPTAMIYHHSAVICPAHELPRTRTVAEDEDDVLYGVAPMPPVVGRL